MCVCFAKATLNRFKVLCACAELLMPLSLPSSLLQTHPLFIHQWGLSFSNFRLFNFTSFPGDNDTTCFLSHIISINEWLNVNCVFCHWNLNMRKNNYREKTVILISLTEAILLSQPPHMPDTVCAGYRPWYAFAFCSCFKICIRQMAHYRKSFCSIANKSDLEENVLIP